MTAPTVDFLIPGRLDTPTGGFGYDRRIIEGLGELGWQVRAHELPADFPRPRRAARAALRAVLAALPDGRRVVADGLVLGGTADLLAEAAPRLNLVALVHHPLALESGLAAETAAALATAEREALAHARRVVVTSPWTARTLTTRFGVAARHIDVVVPGTRVGRAAEGTQSGPLRLLCVATLTPRKGHRALLDALARLTGLDWRLDCVGSDERDTGRAASLERVSAHAGLGDRVRWHGALDAHALAGFYERADLFVLASELEGYGMALAEALAHAVPVVSTTAGAIPDTVPDDAGLLVPPGDVGALADTLERVIRDAGLRASLKAGAARARLALPDWQDASRAFAAALDRARAV